MCPLSFLPLVLSVCPPGCAIPLPLLCSGRGRISYDDLNEQEQIELMALCKKFLDGSREVDDLPQDTMKAVRETFKQMRNVYQVRRSSYFFARKLRGFCISGRDNEPSPPPFRP
jgi:hypothetical protein